MERNVLFSGPSHEMPSITHMFCMDLDGIFSCKEWNNLASRSWIRSGFVQSAFVDYSSSLLLTLMIYVTTTGTCLAQRHGCVFNALYRLLSMTRQKSSAWRKSLHKWTCGEFQFLEWGDCWRCPRQPLALALSVEKWRECVEVTSQRRQDL